MSICYDRFAELKKFTDRVGNVYGTEDFALYLYSIVKMTKPTNVVELGTGLGSTMLWIAQGLKENQSGILHTIDDGSDWSGDNLKPILQEYHRDQYCDYINNLLNTFDLKQYINFYNSKIQWASQHNNIDILFSDFSHGPYEVLKLLAESLVKMNDNSFIFIDSASTYYPSYQILTSTIDYLNHGKIPKTLIELVEPGLIEDFIEKVNNSRFELSHIIENKNRNQNSTTQIKIVPIDIMPQPRKNIRF